MLCQNSEIVRSAHRGYIRVQREKRKTLGQFLFSKKIQSEPITSRTLALRQEGLEEVKSRQKILGYTLRNANHTNNVIMPGK